MVLQLEWLRWQQLEVEWQQLLRRQRLQPEPLLVLQPHSVLRQQQQLPLQERYKNLTVKEIGVLLLPIAGGAFLGGASGFATARSSASSSSSISSSNASTQTISQPKITYSIQNDVVNLPRTGSALKIDSYHAFPNVVDNYAGYAVKSPISNGTLYQLQGSLNGVSGRFEWIIQNGQVTHRMFVPGGGINGIPIMP